MKLNIPKWLAKKKGIMGVNMKPKTSLTGTVKKETEKAILFESEGNEAWFPKSQVDLEEEEVEGE